MNKLQERKNNNKGFSLVELIIVIAIMAVLVAILAPAFMRYVEESRQKADISATDSVIQSVKAAYTNSEFKVDGTTSITLKYNGNPDVTGSDEFKAALKNSDVHEAQLKSKQWGNVVLTFTEATTGALKVKITESGTASVHMYDKYNDGKNK